jgi:hypothetical protein
MPTRKLSALIIETAGLSALTRATRHITVLQRLYTVCAPPEMLSMSRVVGHLDGMLVIAADNGAIAAKLRQLVPRLLEKLQKQGAEVTAIRVQVQVGRTAATHLILPKKPALPIDLIDNFEKLSKRVKNPELGSALARFASRRRNGR